MLPDASLPELFAIWPEVVEDLESVTPHMPDTIAADIAADFASVRDELLKRQRIANQARDWCTGHDGSMLHLVPPGEPPPDL